MDLKPLNPDLQQGLRLAFELFERRNEKYLVQRCQIVRALITLLSTFQYLQNCLHRWIFLVCPFEERLKKLVKAAYYQLPVETCLEQRFYMKIVERCYLCRLRVQFMRVSKRHFCGIIYIKVSQKNGF